MSRWGIGPKFTVLSILFGGAVAALQYLVFPNAGFVIHSRLVNTVLGAGLVAAGLIIFLAAAMTIDKYYAAGRLCKKGAYALMRHPIYGSWISLIMPGLVVLTGSALGLAVPLFMYVLFRALISAEERYLEEKFGDDFRDYRSKVWAVVPKIWGR
jgi:protein-S-isoprenylcysteine O-methyltransferase Ste14